MGKKEIKESAISIQRYKDIIDLRKNKEYDKIFEIYGQTIYKFAVPHRYKKNEIDQLLEEGRFEDIYRKYGPGTYKEQIGKMQALDIYHETGSIRKSIMARIKRAFRKKILPIALSVGLGMPSAATGVIVANNAMLRHENSIEYAEEIEKYSETISQYAEEIKKMNLTDIQIIAKIMKDMWENIDGYREPQNDITGYLGLTLQEEGIGVCENFADYMVAVLNEVNPEYNARSIVVYMGKNSYNFANIQRNIIKTNKTIADAEQKKEDNQNEKQEKKEKFDLAEVFEKFRGNHAIVLMDISDMKCTLEVDITNPSVGILKDGKIISFATKDGKGYEISDYGQLFLGGYIATHELIQDQFMSFLPCEYSVEEVKEKFGIQALNNALEEVEEKEESEGKGFVPRFKVDEAKAIREANNKIPKKENMKKSFR